MRNDVGEWQKKITMEKDLFFSWKGIQKKGTDNMSFVPSLCKKIIGKIGEKILNLPVFCIKNSNIVFVEEKSLKMILQKHMYNVRLSKSSWSSIYLGLIIHSVKEFSVTHILREIKVGDFWGFKTALLGFWHI